MAKPKDFSLLLFRSAPTAWDLDDRLAGASDHPICPVGRETLERAIDQLDDTTLDVVLTATDESSVQSAELLAASTRAKVRKLKSIDEVALGLWEGLRPEDIADKYPSASKQWVNNPSSVRVPGGESLIEAERRILEGLINGLDKVKAARPRVGVVVRPMTWGLLRCWLSDAPIDQIWDILRDAPMYGWYEVEREKLESIHGTVGVQP